MGFPIQSKEMRIQQITQNKKDHDVKCYKPKWKISGFYKHNPHLWCSTCGWYLSQSDIEIAGLQDIFLNLLKNDNPEGYYL